jgi:6-phosphofructokinase
MLKHGVVVTADLVNSSALELAQLNALLLLLEKRIKAQNGIVISFFRGDSFQCYFPNPATAFRIALMLRADVIQFGWHQNRGVPLDLKLSVAIGGLVVPSIVSEAHGATYELSGYGLDTIEKSHKRFIVQHEHTEKNIGFAAIAMFVDHIMRAITPKQVDILVHLLQGKTQVQIAAASKKSQSTIHQYARDLGWKQLEELERLYIAML